MNNQDSDWLIFIDELQTASASDLRNLKGLLTFMPSTDDRVNDLHK